MTYRMWTDIEQAVINKAVLDGTKARFLDEMLPGRSRPQIQCQLATARRKLRGDAPWKDPEDQKRDVDAIRAQGVCCWCRERLVDGTLIACAVCAENRAATSSIEIDTRKAQADMLPWIFSRHPGQLVSWLPDTAKKVVDLFGGSGRFTRAVVRRKFKKVIFNDVHPLLAPYGRALAAREHDAINLVASELAIDSPLFSEHYRQSLVEVPDDVMAAATVRMAAFNSRNCHLDRVKTISFAPRLQYVSDSRLWQKMDFTTQDWKDSIEAHDGRNTAFIIDPPYPGTDYYEYNFEWVQFKALVETLANIRGKFLMVAPTNRKIVELCQKYEMFTWMRRVKMFKGSGRDLVVANYPLGDASLEPIDAARYGLRRSDKQQDLVDDVVRAVEEWGGFASRQEITTHLGAENTEVLGAISRARAEGRLSKHTKKSYCLPGYEKPSVKTLMTSPPLMTPAKQVKVAPEEPIQDPRFDSLIEAIDALDHDDPLDHAVEDAQPFKIYATRNKVVGEVDAFVSTMNNLGYEVVFHSDLG